MDLFSTHIGPEGILLCLKEIQTEELPVVEDGYETGAVVYEEDSGMDADIEVRSEPLLFSALFINSDVSDKIVQIIKNANTVVATGASPFFVIPDWTIEFPLIYLHNEKFDLHVAGEVIRSNGTLKMTGGLFFEDPHSRVRKVQYVVGGSYCEVQDLYPVDESDKVFFDVTDDSDPLVGFVQSIDRKTNLVRILQCDALDDEASKYAPMFFIPLCNVWPFDI